MVNRCPQKPVFTTTPNQNVYQPHCSEYSFHFGAVSDSLPITYSVNKGTINPTTGEFTCTDWWWPPCGMDSFVVTAANICGTTDFPFIINWTNNNPVISNCPTTVQKAGCGGMTYVRAFTAVESDPCDALTWSVAQTGGPVPSGTYSINDLGVFSFAMLTVDGGNAYQFTVTVTDPCGGSSSCAFIVELMNCQPFLIKIEKTHNSLQGHYEYVSITEIDGSEMMGGFDFLLAYDASALTFTSAELGSALQACGWEYFTYRCGLQCNCGRPCPSGFVRVVAIADQNNGAHHPTCFKPAMTPGELVNLKFYITNDRNFECMYVPIRFGWLDCGDNTISSMTGDTLWISEKVFDFENTNPMLDPNYEITGTDCEFPFHYGGACPDCDSVSLPGKPSPQRHIIFWNGGIDIACAPDIDARGDLNLNGIADEIADAVMYTNYFLYGMSALPVIGREGAIEASDVNNDGRPLTVGDLVYLLRVIVGDALPYPKLIPFGNAASVNFANGSFVTESADEIGAIYVTFAVNGAYNVVSNTSMEVVQSENNGELRVLVYSGMSNLTNRISAGANVPFTVSGEVELKSVEVADYDGNMMDIRVNKTAFPSSFALSQNIPNPFNPITKIGLSLPTQSDWTLNIYNVAGQLVKDFRGNNIGNVTVEWDASMVPSGVYLYKLNAGSYSDTKKMVLMK